MDIFIYNKHRKISDILRKIYIEKIICKFYNSNIKLWFNIDSYILINSISLLISCKFTVSLSLSHYFA